MVVPRGNAPRSSAYQADALLLSYGTSHLRFETYDLRAVRKLWLDAESSRGPESHNNFWDWPEANDSSRLVTLAKEQLALITDDRFHGIPFVAGLIWRKASVMLRPPGKRILFSGQAQPAYICLPSKNGCQGWTRTSTVRFNKPSCYFDTTWQIGAAGRSRTCVVP